MTGLAELCLEAYRFHERLVVFLPDGMSLKVPVKHDTFHVVCQDILWNPHIAERMKHSNEQVLLLGIGEKLHLLLTAVVAHHSKAGNIVFAVVVVYHFGEAPVHLVSLSRLCSEPAATAALWRHQLPLGGDEMFMGCNVSLNRAETALKAEFL